VIVAVVLLVAGIGSLALVTLELCKAPEGYEDDRGFHTVRKGTLGYDVPGSAIKKTLGVLKLAEAAIPTVRAARYFYIQ
jgi:hypothetical protein